MIDKSKVLDNDEAQVSGLVKLSHDKRYQPKSYVELRHPEWSKNATIYEVNIRQYTSEGTFNAFKSRLPHLKELGVAIIWLMPIHPIGLKNRKGNLGSSYSIKDYYKINPEFGTLADFKELVRTIHRMGMYVIIDWVANHSSWDNMLVSLHPDWYTKNPQGGFQSTPWYDWDDIIDFDYEQPDLRQYMTEVLNYWVVETDIDGYRCDVAGFIPVDFWENVRSELDSIKPVFMLAEWEDRDLHKRAFDMTYSWRLWDRLHEITVGNKPIASLLEYLAQEANTFPNDGYRMTFTENHDKNASAGNQYSNFGAGLPLCMVFCSMVKGMPLIYGGQESGLNRSLSFYEKDLIEWKQHPFFDLYRSLFTLKHQNQALWNGHWGGELMRIQNDKPEQVISFARKKNGDKVLSISNFSDTRVKVVLTTVENNGLYQELFTGRLLELTGDSSFWLEPWGYLVFVGNELR